MESSFEKLGIQKDVSILNNDHSIAWTHRKIGADDVYFISNQKETDQNIELVFRNGDEMGEVWSPVSGQIIRR